MNGQQVPPWMQRRPVQPGFQQPSYQQPQPQYVPPRAPYGPPVQQYPGPMGQPPLQQSTTPLFPGGPMGLSSPPGMGPPPGSKPPKLPSEKKKRTLRILVGLLIFTTLVAVGTGIYFYVTYVR